VVARELQRPTANSAGVVALPEHARNELATCARWVQRRTAAVQPRHQCRGDGSGSARVRGREREVGQNWWCNNLARGGLGGLSTARGGPTLMTWWRGSAPKIGARWGKARGGGEVGQLAASQRSGEQGGVDLGGSTMSEETVRARRPWWQRR
jgi:hypothetical protein